MYLFIYLKTFKKTKLYGAFLWIGFNYLKGEEPLQRDTLLVRRLSNYWKFFRDKNKTERKSFWACAFGMLFHVTGKSFVPFHYSNGIWNDFNFFCSFLGKIIGEFVTCQPDLLISWQLNTEKTKLKKKTGSRCLPSTVAKVNNIINSNHYNCNHYEL